jgi:hypothetical protein
VPGTRSQPGNICDSCQGYSPTAVTANQILFEYVANAYERITGVKYLAVTAGTGAGNTVGDILLNGTSIWNVNPANKPTLLATAVGEFNNALPDVNYRNLRPGDRLTLEILSVSTTGHARVTCNVTFEANA